MKRFIFALAAMAAVFASCQKAEVSEPASNDFKLDITVADLGTSDELATKAMIKTLWTKDDLIGIWYDGNTQSVPDLMIVYDGANWNEIKNANTSGNKPSTGEGKYIKALYNGQVIATSKDSYIFSNNTLTFSINNWNFLSEIQVVVTGTTGNVSYYTLACDKFTPIISYNVGSEAITATTGSKGDAATGFESEANPGCATFVFATADYTTGDATDTYSFTLKKCDYTTAYYTPAAKSFPKDTKCIKGIKMTTDNFSTGITAGHSWAQLWAGGPKFALRNVGATIVNYSSLTTSTSDLAHLQNNYSPYFTENVGGLYAWGTPGKNGRQTTWSKDVNLGEYVDVATQIWGEHWKTPTKADLNNLRNYNDDGSAALDLTEWTWCDGSNTQYVSGCTLAGFKVSGKAGTAYENNCIFLPAASRYNSFADVEQNMLFGFGERVYLWSATETTATYAYYLYASDNLTLEMKSEHKSIGMSVRAVLAE